jgi:hypothetical protein
LPPLFNIAHGPPTFRREWQWNNASAGGLTTVAIARQEQTLHETAFIDRACSQHFYARFNPIRVSNAERKPERTHHYER